MSERTALAVCAHVFVAAALSSWVFDAGPALVALGWIFFIALAFWYCDYNTREDAKAAERERIRREILR